MLGAKTVNYLVKHSSFSFDWAIERVLLLDKFNIFFFADLAICTHSLPFVLALQ